MNFGDTASYETAIYFLSILFQIAAMAFCLLMIRLRTHRLPWVLMFSAMAVMLCFRTAALVFPELRMARSMQASAGLLVSILLFAALFSIRKLAKAERTSHSVYQAIGESLDYGVWVCDAEGRNTYASQSFLKLVGMSQNECASGGWMRSLHPDEREATAAGWSVCVQTGGNWYREHRFKGADDQWHPILACGVPVRGERGQITCWAGINLDIRKLKETEQRERDARTAAERQSRMKDEFLATLSHELRTPLTAIVGWTQLVRKQPDDMKMLKEAIEVIDRNARAQWRLIEDLLDMSRIISGKMRLDLQQVQPAEFIEAAIDAVRPAAEAKGIAIRKVLDPLAGPVTGDPNRLQQVIWNLLSNAIKFTPRGGKIEVLLERVNSHLEITVTDTGQGIKPEFLPYLFDRFRQADSSTTRQFGGLGIGLAIVKNLVEMHGGQVRAKSGGDKAGATFTVALPLRITESVADGRDHPALGPETGTAAESTDLKGLRTLVVDDDADSRELLTRLLDECNATVVSAKSAADAERLIDEFQPDLIISDIGMPGRDGYQFIEAVRGRGIKTPAIALTAFARSEDRTRALRSGYQMHLSKPVEPAELIAVVGSVSGRVVAGETAGL